MILKKIDLYCQEKHINRSKLLTNCTLAYISSRGGITCGFMNCRNPSIGKYKLTIYDWNQGETQKELQLCQYHIDKAKQEGQEATLIQ